MKPEQILVADDEDRIVESIARCLTREGFEVSCAYDGRQAVDLFQKQRFDLILLDISMPEMNGYEAMEQMLMLNPDALIIIMTGFASVESAVSALKQGAWDYLKKPFEFADLIKTVKNGIAQHNLIVEKKAVSARLEASEKKYQYMVNNSPDLIFTLDENLCFSFTNEQFETLLGFSEEELTGVPFVNILHGDDCHKISRLIPAVFDDSREETPPGNSIELHLRFKKANAEESRYDPYAGFAFMEMKAAAFSPAGTPGPGGKGIYGVARDVTERFQLEAQLRQAQKMEAIGTLAGGIAHDFNNILMGIQGYSSLVKSGFKSDSDVYKRLANIDEYVHSGAEMASQLLGFSQKSCQKPATNLNLNFLLKMSAKMFGRTRKDIIIRQELEKDLWRTMVDEVQLKQVLMNLFVNAWQAMPGGGVITVRSENVAIGPRDIETKGLEQPGNFIKVSVADTGIGMDEEVLSRIFDPFFTTKARGQGTGLGLSTAFGIIKGHKGGFEVESFPGRGSVFMFYLPAVAKEVFSDQTFALPQKENRIITGQGCVLIVDDEKGVIDVCREMLETLGYEVLVAENGDQAVSAVEKDPSGIDLMILDMVMPGMNGPKTYEAVRKVNSDLRVLVCSGYARKGEIQEMIEKGCDDFILKPFDIIKLSRKLESIFNNSAGTGPKVVNPA